MTQAHPLTGGKHLVAEDKKDQVLQLRVQGATLQQCANHVGVSLAMAHKYVKSALEELSANTAMNAEEYRQIEIEKLDLAERYARANLDGEALINSLIKIHDRRVRLLGLLAPTKHVHTDGLDEIAFANVNSGEALERLRLARAEKAEIELAQMKARVITVDEVKEKFRLMSRHLARAADDMRRKGYNDALDILNAALDSIAREEQRGNSSEPLAIE